MSTFEFDRLVEEAFASIPGKFRSQMRNVVIVVEPYGPSRDLLGLYEGRPATERAFTDTQIDGPDRIRVFQRPHEEMARNRAHLRRLVLETVWHEVGHLFGLSEAEIHAVEYRRERIRLMLAPAREVAKRTRNR